MSADESSSKGKKRGLLNIHTIPEVLAVGRGRGDIKGIVRESVKLQRNM
jgi:hypothetical protein